MTHKRLGIAIVLAIFITACGQTESDPTVLKVMTHDSFAVSEEVVKAFEAEHHVTVEFLRSGDAGISLNKAILSVDNPLADVFYGVDNTFLGRALEEGIFETYNATALEQIPNELQLDPNNGALPVDYGHVCLNYDKEYFAEKALEPPNSLNELLEPEYNNLTVVQNPASSSPGLAFLIATVGKYGEDGYLGYWEGLLKNGVLVANKFYPVIFQFLNIYFVERIKITDHYFRCQSQRQAVSCPAIHGDQYIPLLYFRLSTIPTVEISVCVDHSPQNKTPFLLGRESLI